MIFRNVVLGAACAVMTAAIAPCGVAQTNRGGGLKIYQETLPPRPCQARHLLYIATPGDPALYGQSGIVVLDADHDFRFVKRMSYGLAASELPGPKVSGIAASVAENMIYVTFIGHMTAFDLKTDRVVWTFNGEPGGVARHFPSASTTGCCERPWTLPDGRTLMVSSSFSNWWYYIDAHTGAVKGKIVTPKTPIAHNLVVTPDGKTAFLSSQTGPQQNLAGISIVDVAQRKVIRTMSFSDAVRPITINHDGSLVYVNVNGLDGFEIGDPATGKMIKRVELPNELWRDKWNGNSNHYPGSVPSHGLGITPDDSEIWVSDTVNSAWQVWDNPGDGRNPVYNPSKTVPVTPGVESTWISMSNDGMLAFVADGSIIDVHAHKVIAMMKDEFDRPIRAAEKVLYLTFDEGRLVEAGSPFAVGDPKAYRSRIAGPAPSGN